MHRAKNSCCRVSKSRSLSLPPRFVQRPLLTKTNNTIHCNNDDIAPICDVCTQICELQSSLKMYREEVNVYQQQMEELKMNYESKLQKKNEKVEC